MVTTTGSVSTVGGSQTLNRVRQGSEDLTAAVGAYSTEAARAQSSRLCADGKCKGANSMLKALNKAMPTEIKSELASQGVSLKSLLKAGTAAMNNLRKSENSVDQELLKALSAGATDLDSAAQVFMANVQEVYKGSNAELQGALDSFLTELYSKAGFNEATIEETIQAFRNMPKDVEAKVGAVLNKFSQNLSESGAANFAAAEQIRRADLGLNAKAAKNAKSNFETAIAAA